MRRLLRSLTALFLIFFLSLTVQAAETRQAREKEVRLPSFWDEGPAPELAERITAEMTDAELLAQILMFGWAGTDPSPLVTAWVEQRGLGSIKVFGWNTDNTHKVAESVAFLQQKASQGRFEIPLLVATDQEGGWIRHIKGQTTETPGNLAIGASGLPKDAWYSGYYISRELRALGINLNFAPTIDLYTDHKSTVIGPRSFGEDPVASGILGAAFVAGSRAAGVLTTAKHYPGHGHTGLDSHGFLPVITINERTLRERELVPFKYLIEAGVPAIMSGHLSFPSLPDRGVPATFSRWQLHDLLRVELGFEGLIITDDIMMNGATSWAGSVSRAVQLAIEAGNDIVESSTTPHFNDALWRNSLDRMQNDPAFASRVRESARRVIRTKLEYFRSHDPVPILPDMSLIDKRVPHPDAGTFFQGQAARSVTLIRGSLLPYEPAPGERLIIAGPYRDFLSAGAARYPGAELVHTSSGDLHRRARNADTVIFCLATRDQIPLLQSLRNSGARILVVSALAPVHLAEVPWVDLALAVYSYAPVSFRAAFAALKGDFPPMGILPLSGLD